MAPDPIEVTIDHPAPMLLRMGRGNKLGVFAVRQTTRATIRGVDPDELVALGKDEHQPLGVPDDVRRHAGALWLPVRGMTHWEGGGPAIRRVDATLSDALAHLGDPVVRLPDRVYVSDLDRPPFRSRIDGPLRHAKAFEARGDAPPESRDLVEPARSAASAAVIDHVERAFVHDGTHLYARMQVPLLDLSDPGVAKCGLPRNGAPPLLSHRRVNADGSTEAGWVTVFPRATVARLADFMVGIDDGEADIDRFLLSAPYDLLRYLRGMDAPAAEGHLERVWPLVLDAELDRTPACGREEAVEILRSAALAVLDGHKDMGLKNKRSVVRSLALFVQRVARPALTARALPEDDAEAVERLAPGA